MKKGPLKIVSLLLNNKKIDLNGQDDIFFCLLFK